MPPSAGRIELSRKIPPVVSDPPFKFGLRPFAFAPGGAHFAGGVVQQFWTDVAWDVDYLFVDMPPGTGDVPLSVFQSIALDGIIVVTSPQELVSMVVEKAVKMAEKMDVPIVGVVENMSYVACPDCGKKIYLFGEGKSEEAAKRHNLPLLAQMPIDPKLAALVDAGRIEEFEGTWLNAAADALEKTRKRAE